MWSGLIMLFEYQGHIWASDAGPIRDSDCKKGYERKIGAVLLSWDHCPCEDHTSRELLGSRFISDSEPHYWLWGTLLALHSDANESQNRRLLDLGLAVLRIVESKSIPRMLDEVRTGGRRSKGFQIALGFVTGDLGWLHMFESRMIGKPLVGSVSQPDVDAYLCMIPINGCQIFVLP